MKLVGLIAFWLSLAWLTPVGAQPLERLPPLEIEGWQEAAALTLPGDATPVSIGPDALRSSAQVSLPGLLRQQAGVNFTGFFGPAAGGSPQMRGFGENASSRVLILLDGLPMNRPDLGPPDWLEFPLAGLQRVEVARGARTVRYGSSALAGVISLETRRQVDQLEVHLQGAAGSWDTQLWRASALLPVGDGWVFSASTDLFRTDGWRDHSGITSEAFQLGLFSPDDRPVLWRATFSGNESRLENPGGLGLSRYQRNPRQSVYEVFGVEDQYVNRFRSLRTTQQMITKHAGGGRSVVNAAWSGREREIDFGAGSHTNHDLNAWTIDWVRETRIGNCQFDFGLRGQFDTLDLQRFRTQARRESFASAELSRVTAGAFAEVVWQIDDSWTATAGASWDEFRLSAEAANVDSPFDPASNFDQRTTDGAPGFECALEFRPTGRWRVWTRYDRVFRFPLLDEVAGYQGFVLDQAFNAGLRPERGNAIEVGSAWVGNWGSLQASAFGQWLDGEIIYDFRQNLNRNFESTRRYGIEASWEWQQGPWSARFNYQWVRAEFAEGIYRGRDIPLVPEHSFNGQFGWRLSDRFNLSCEWDWLSASVEGNDFENRRSELPERLLWNLEARFALTDKWEIFGRVDNLFDERWALLKYQGQYYPGNGRGFTLGCRAEF